MAAADDGRDADETRTGALLGAEPDADEPVGERLLIRAGDSLGPYVIEEKCGRGGFGSVFRARTVEGDRTVALKVLHWFLADDAAGKARFDREIAAARRVVHPNIVRLFDAGIADNGRPYFAMEWLAGGTLSQELDTVGPMSLPEALAILRPLCDALATAHAAGVVHRDLKPSNVMLVRRDGERIPVLVDFGIAKVFETDTGKSLAHTQSSVRIGSPHIMAPEQIRGGRIDGRTDIYALGALLYAMLTARMPFVAEDAVELQTMHLESPPPKASAVAPVDGSVDAVIVRCMSKDREDRYASVADLLDALDEVVAGERGGRAPTEVPRESIAFAVYLSASAGDDPDDDALDALDDAIDSARDGLVAQGFDVAADTAAGFVAVFPLAPEPATARAQRRALLAKLMELGDTPAPGVRIDITAHVGSVTLTRVGRGNRYVGGELLRTHEWAVSHPGGGLVASQAATRGLDDELALTSVAEAPTLLYVAPKDAGQDGGE